MVELWGQVTCVTYSNGSTLYYAYYDGTVWKSQTIHKLGETYYADLAFNGNVPAVAFCAGRWGGGMKYAYQQGATWAVETVDAAYSTYSRNRQSSITLRFGGGKPLIAYNDEDTRSLKFAYPSGTSWQIRELEASKGEKNYTGDNASMQVVEHDGSYTIYILHSNFTINQTSSIRLKTLEVSNDSDLAKAFKSETLYSTNFLNMTPWMTSAVKDGNPSVAFLDFWYSTTHFVSMQPRVKASSSLSLGAVAPNETASREIAITNNGSLPLSISDIQSTAAPFSFTGDKSGVLAPGESLEITVSFNPTVAGESYEGKLAILSNDPDKPCFEIKLTGRSIGSNAELTEIKLSNGALLPMEAETTEYNVEAAYATETIRVTPTAAHAYAIIKVNGAAVITGKTSSDIALEIGENTITIAVTSEDGNAEKTYTLKITRRASPDARLSALSVSAGELSPEFSPEIESYTMTLPDGVSKLAFTARAAQPTSDIHIGETTVKGQIETEEFTVPVGRNTYTILVTAPDGESTKTYTFNVLHLPELSGITLDTGSLEETFEPYSLTYSTVVPCDVTAIELTPAADVGCGFKINGTALEGVSSKIDLNPGDNEISIQVLSADGETSREYTLTVKRLEGLYALSVGNKQVIAGYNYFNLSVEIVKASDSIIFSAPEGVQVKINGEVVDDGISPILNFSLGDNDPIIIEMISAECIETAVYSLTVTRLPTLTGLEIGGLNVPLWDNEFHYFYQADHDTDSVTINAISNDGTSIRLDGNIVYSGENGNWTISNLQVGSNFAYLVLENDKYRSEYSIIIKRPPTLQSLTVSEGTLSPGFDPGIFNYEVNVGKEIDSITINAEASTNSAYYPEGSVSINGEYPYSQEASVSLSYGSNLIPVSVVRNDYVNTTYFVNVVREAPVFPVLSPAAAYFLKDSENSADVSAVITWNEASFVSDIKASGISIGSENYSVDDIDGDTAKLTIKKEYLALNNLGPLVLTVEFDKDISAQLRINITRFVTVQFLSDGSNHATKTLKMGDSLGTDWPSNPTRSGYTFAGWYTGEDGTGNAVTGTTVINSDMAVYAKWTVYTSGGGTPTSPSYSDDITGGGNVSVTVDRDKGASANIGAISNRISDGEKITINVPPIQGINSYTANLPAASISDPGGGSLTMNTDLGSVTIPGNMLSGTDHSGNAGVSISRADTSKLPDDIKEAIGDRPVIQLNLTINGQAAQWSNPDAPVTVSIPYKPSSEELEHPEGIVLWYIDGSGNPQCMTNGRYDPSTGNVLFSTTHFSNYAVSYQLVRFGDVETDSWYSKAVGFIAAREITKGTGGGNFNPGDELTRGEFIVLMMRAYGIAPDTNSKDNFADSGNSYYTDYLAAAKRLNISSGVGDNMFAPERLVTRQEMFTLLYNTLEIIKKLPQGNSGKAISDFSDASQIDEWAKKAIELLVSGGTVQGSAGKLAPLDTATRAEMAQMLYNLLNK